MHAVSRTALMIQYDSEICQYLYPITSYTEVHQLNNHLNNRTCVPTGVACEITKTLPIVPECLLDNLGSDLI